MYNCDWVMTDGGSIQEEAYQLGKPCLIIRTATERQDGIGRNALLAKFDLDVWNKFSKEWKNFRYSPQENKVSPTKYIVDYLKSRKYE